LTAATTKATSPPPQWLRPGGATKANQNGPHELSVRGGFPLIKHPFSWLRKREPFVPLPSNGSANMPKVYSPDIRR
jgi:hypothetical protein